jgi:hypothetical protein
MSEKKRRRVDCACGDHNHSIVFDVDDEPGFSRVVYVSLTANRWEMSFWQRVKYALSVIRGNDEHVLSGIVLEAGDNLEPFVEAVCSLMHSSDTGQGGA